MAKKSAIEKNKHRRKMVLRDQEKRCALKKVIMQRSTSPEERVAAVMKLASLPRNGAAVRVRNRCEITGRPRGFYRKFRMSRIALRELGNMGMITGLVKSSW